jgi:hypothetical protein
MSTPAPQALSGREWRRYQRLRRTAGSVSRLFSAAKKLTAYAKTIWDVFPTDVSIISDCELWPIDDLTAIVVSFDQFVEPTRDSEVKKKTKVSDTIVS